MALPKIHKTWTISANNRIPFVSLNDTMSKYLFQVKTFLKANGYLVKGSSNGTTGAMDNVDRWITAANVTTRGAAAGNAQSWIVLQDGNGVWILLTYQGATDDIARFSYSPNQLFLAAGTPQNQPTATDEVVFVSGVTVIATPTSADRLWFGWVDSESKHCRFFIARSGIVTGQIWGVERTLSVVTGSGVVWTPPVWGFGFAQNSQCLTGPTTAGQTRTVIASLVVLAACVLGMEYLANTSTAFGSIKPELQGSTGYPIYPLTLASTTAGSRGKLANLFDWWCTRTSGGIDGDMYGNMQFIGLSGATSGSGNGSTMWPWDGVTSPVFT